MALELGAGAPEAGLEVPGVLMQGDVGIRRYELPNGLGAMGEDLAIASLDLLQQKQGSVRVQDAQKRLYLLDTRCTALEAAVSGSSARGIGKPLQNHNDLIDKLVSVFGNCSWSEFLFCIPPRDGTNENWDLNKQRPRSKPLL